MIDLIEFKRSLEYAYNELQEDLVINTSGGRNTQILDEGKSKVFYRLGNFLHWCNTIIDRCQGVFPVRNDDLLLALRGANNAMKHDVKIIELRKYERGGFTFPTSFPFSIPAPSWVWGELVAPGGLRYEDQEEAYNKKLKGNDIQASIQLFMSNSL